MFYTFTDTLTEIPENSLKISPDILTVGYVTSEELDSVAKTLNFAPSTVEACRRVNTIFRSGVEVYDNYTFTELRIIDTAEENEDCVALYIGKNLIIVVDAEDKDMSTKNKFISALSRFPAQNVTAEKILYAFLDTLLSGDVSAMEKISVELSELEERLLHDDVDKTLNASLLQTKKLLLRLHNYYEQILDITETIDENENQIFDDEPLMYIGNIEKRVIRLREDADSLKNTVEHLQDAYTAYLDAKMNNTMKIFTIITSVFFPITIIVGWYGMNFVRMPELTWQYGYLYVIVLSVIVVLAMYLLGKKKKWY